MIIRDTSASHYGDRASGLYPTDDLPLCSKVEEVTLASLVPVSNEMCSSHSHGWDGPTRQAPGVPPLPSGHSPRPALIDNAIKETTREGGVHCCLQGCLSKRRYIRVCKDRVTVCGAKVYCSMA